MKRREFLYRTILAAGATTVGRWPARALAGSTLDAPVVALGKRSPLNFSEQLPDLQHGVHINLFNNAWGTNYIQWAGGDWIYRFRLSVG